jgi:ATP-binding cassette subfamily F protein 3
LLLLDEPTNHLDIEARAALVEALNGFPGAVVLVSHDPFLINHVADRLWRLVDGTCRPYEGDLEDYRRAVLEDARNARRQETSDPDRPGDRRAGRRDAAKARKTLVPLRQAAGRAEKAVAVLNADLAEIERKLTKPETHSGPSEVLRNLLKRRGLLRKQIEAAEARWMEAAETLEAARDD